LARADTASQAPPSLESMDLADAVRQACSDMEVMATRADVQLAAQIPGTCPFRGDPELIRRLLVILLDNAIKYTPGGGRVSVDFGLNERFASISIWDTGEGIPEEDLPRIFDRFYRTSKDRSRQTGGAGLGLAIARSIVDRHAGEITMESQLGAGSNVFVRFPL